MRAVFFGGGQYQLPLCEHIGRQEAIDYTGFHWRIYSCRKEETPCGFSNADGWTGAYSGTEGAERAVLVKAIVAQQLKPSIESAAIPKIEQSDDSSSRTVCSLATERRTAP